MSTQARWRRAARCSGVNSTCVEVAATADGVAVRDSKDPSGPVLRFTAEEWRVFVAGVRAGEFDV